MSDGFILRSAFEDLCVESGWPVARLTFFGSDERVTLWSVAPGLETLRDSWEAAGQLSSFSARVASNGRPMLHANEMDLADFGDAACEEGLHWTVSFPLFVDAEVVGAIEACAPNRPRVEGLLRSGRLLGSLLVSGQRAA
ncbi:MAG: GAF domain-containing protein [Deltaproteobacteria bacterium]|nr:MAG: GAF domain-containing protein [Deltaproteobacteria bacterium]